jgi:multiple sugar transport system substrate-binding protein
LRGDLVFLHWTRGGEHRMFRELEAMFAKQNPGIKIREVEAPLTGDPRTGIRTAMESGTQADIMINAWPAFRIELAKAGKLHPLDKAWDKQKWSNNLSNKWRSFASVDGVTYGLNYTYGDRSGMFYFKNTLQKAGVPAPKTWEQFLASFAKLRAIGITPVAMPAKVWAHGEWFESMLLRTAGVEAASKLAAHKIAWTDPVVKRALRKYAEMLKAGCCDAPAQMLADDSDQSQDKVLKSRTHGYLLSGMWVNEGAQHEYQLREGVDFGLLQFPSMGLGFDDTSSIDTRELVVLRAGGNSAAAEAFQGWMAGPEAAAVLARNGVASSSSKVQASLYGPVVASSIKAVSASKIQFVLGDLLPGDLVDEYRLQLQRFLQDPSDENIDKVLAAIEAKATQFYK